MATTETLRFDVDPETSGLFQRAKGDVHSRGGKRLTNGETLRVLSDVYVRLGEQEPALLSRILNRGRAAELGLDPR